MKASSRKVKLNWLIAEPLQPRTQRKSCNIGLFGGGRRNQLELFQPAGAPSATNPRLGDLEGAAIAGLDSRLCGKVSALVGPQSRQGGAKL